MDVIKMKIISNTSVPRQQSKNYILGELSNVSMVIQSNQVLVEYFSINADSSTLVHGFKNIDEYVSKDSSVIYDMVDNLPIGGIENLVQMSEYNDETGYDVEFEGQGLVFPNTITPKPGDCFIVKNDGKKSLYIITNASQTVVRSNPFVEISFTLYSSDKDKVKQLYRQVRKRYIVTVTSLANDRTLVIEEKKYVDIQKDIKTYLEVCDMYISLFYDKRKSMFIFNEIYHDNRKYRIIDIPLWKFLYDNEIIVFDSIVTYAINNMNLDINRVYIDEPSRHIDRFEYRKTPLYRLFERNEKKDFSEYTSPVFTLDDDRVSKYDGINVYYISSYDDNTDFIEELKPMLWLDTEFIDRIIANVQYEVEMDEINIYLRNAIIAYYNHEEVDFDSIILSDERSVDNFYLIPLLLAIFKSHIIDTES